MDLLGSFHYKCPWTHNGVSFLSSEEPVSEQTISWSRQTANQRYRYILEEGKARLQEAMALNWIGFFLYGTGVHLFLPGISFGANVFSW
jgi:hypothetical protein